MLSAGCVMSGMVDAGEKYDNPPVFQTSIIQFGTEWIVIINSEFPKRVTTVSQDDSSVLGCSNPLLQQKLDSEANEQ